MNVSTAAKDVPLTEAWKPFLSRLNFHFASSFPSAAFVFVCPPHLATSCAKKPPKSPEREQPPAAPETNKRQMKTRARMWRRLTTRDSAHESHACNQGAMAGFACRRVVRRSAYVFFFVARSAQQIRKPKIQAVPKK